MPTIDQPKPWVRSTPSVSRVFNNPDATGVPYHFRLKLHEAFARDASISVAWVECIFDDGGKLKQDFFESAVYPGGQPRLNRSLPLANFYYPQHFIQQMDMEDFEPERPDGNHVASHPESGFPDIDGYVCYRLTFGMVPYAVLSDDAVDTLAATQNGLSPNCCVPEMFRFLRVTRRYLPESRKIPGLGYEVYDPLGEPPAGAFKSFVVLEVGSIPTFQVEIVAETILWPAANFPDGGVQVCLGTVNKNAIFIDGTLYPAGTLLYKGPATELTKYRWIDGDFYFDVPHLFGFRPQGWNMFRTNKPYGPDSKLWWPVRAKGDPSNFPIFPSEDHTKIFKPEPTH